MERESVLGFKQGFQQPRTVVVDSSNDFQGMVSNFLATQLRIFSMNFWPIVQLRICGTAFGHLGK